MSDYLWDGGGSDPEVERLETVLAPLAYRGKLPQLPRRRAPAVLWVVAAAAMVALVVWAPWRVPVFATVAGHAVTTGQWLETVKTTHLELGALGSVELGPSTRARMLGEGRMELDHGSLHARISAPPRRFSIDTRFARLIDLGCAFELAVDASGNGEVLVTEGSVALARDGKETVVPLGLHCRFDAAGVSGPVALPTEAPPQKAILVDDAPQRDKPHKPAPPKKTPPKNVVQKNIAAPQKNPTAPQKNPTAPQKNPAVPQKTDPGLKLHHDALRDLERSAQ